MAKVLNGGAGLLSGIAGPSDVRALPAEALSGLAEELRSVVVETVTRTGGHLGSNLGAVELTIALHRVFESPTDTILFDTGHQCYPHKLLTGRVSAFDSLRQPAGLSGYPNRAESPHDVIENSHASTVLAYAHGIVMAKCSRHVVAVIGDGALTGGMAYEGLNNLGHTNTDCVVVLNDNGRSYAPTISTLVADPATPNVSHDRAERFFTSLGHHYVGPIDGHDIPAVEAALTEARDTAGPSVVHVVTEKGRGYQPALADGVKKMHDTSKFDPASFTATFARTLVALGAEHENLVAITAAMPDSTGTHWFAEAYPDRFLDVGIAEQHAVTTAAGLAMGGKIPVVAIYSTFLTRAIDQITYDVALHKLPVIFCVDRAGITGDDGASHNGVLDLMLLSKVPGMTVFAPSTCEELERMLRQSVAIATGPNPGPVAIRWSKLVPTTTDVPAVPRPLAAGATRLRRGRDVCIVAAGHLAHEAAAAADVLVTDGITVTVWDPRQVHPVDPRVVRDAARHRIVLTVEDGIVDGGFGTRLAQDLTHQTIDAPIPPKVVHAGIPPRFLAHGKPQAILHELGLDAAGIAAHVRRLTRSLTPPIEIPRPAAIDLTGIESSTGDLSTIDLTDPGADHRTPSCSSTSHTQTTHSSTLSPSPITRSGTRSAILAVGA